MQIIEDAIRASGLYSVLVLEFGTAAWSKGKRTSLYMIGVRNEMLPASASSDAAQRLAARRCLEILRTIVLRRAARRPADWDEWLVRPGDAGYSKILARYAGQQVHAEEDDYDNDCSAEDRACVTRTNAYAMINAFIDSSHLAPAQTRRL